MTFTSAVLCRHPLNNLCSERQVNPIFPPQGSEGMGMVRAKDWHQLVDVAARIT